MKALSLSIVTVLTMATCVFAQPPDTLWTRMFGGNAYDDGQSVQQTSDGGFIVVGSNKSYGPGYSDVFVVRTNAGGDTVWTRVLGGSNDEFGHCVQQTLDGGYIVCGSTQSFGAGGHDVWLLRIAAGGDTVWTRTFGGTNHDYGHSVEQTLDGGYIIGGMTESYGSGGRDVYLIKTDALGVEEWSQTIGGISYDECYSVEQTSDDGYVAAGYTRSYGAGSSDVYLVKTNADGDTLWTQTFGTSRGDGGADVQQTSDGGYIICGWLQPGTYKDICLIKTYASGAEDWTQTFGGSVTEYGSAVHQTAGGGYVLVGYTESYGAGANDAYVIKTNPSGVAQWSQTYGGSNNDYGYDVQQTSDGGYIITGYREIGAGGYGDMWLIRLDHATGLLALDQHGAGLRASLAASPNPFNPRTSIQFDVPAAGHVRLCVYDIHGAVVATPLDEWLTAGAYQATFVADDLGSGIYFARLTAGALVQTQKLVLVE